MSVGFDKPTSKWDQILESEEKKPTFLTVTLELKDKLISNWWALDFLIKFKNKIDWKKLIKKSVDKPTFNEISFLSVYPTFVIKRFNWKIVPLNKIKGFYTVLKDNITGRSLSYQFRTVLASSQWELPSATGKGP